MNEGLEIDRSKKKAAFSESPRDSNSLLLLCLVGLFAAGSYYFLSWPISGGGDTDLWYHLNGGRYFFAHKRPPDTGFFSFIAKDRYWANYYWLFQVLVYSVFSALNYYGLIVFRSVLYLLSLGAIACFFLKNTRKETVSFYFFLVSTLFFLALLPRYFALVRPHMFSYLIIVLFLCIFESKKRYWLYFLPLLAIFWVNVHGVEYPVMMLICFAYLADIFVERIKTRTPVSRETLTIVIPVLIALYAVFLTPFGTGLLFAPFKAAPYQHLYIADMKVPELAGFLNFNFTTVTSSFTVFSTLLLLAAVSSCAIGLYTRKVKMSHLLLFAGGLYLLLQAERFRYEAILLSLPLIKSYPPLSLKLQSRKISGVGRAVAVLVITCLALFFLHNVFRPRAHYPSAFSNLPVGTAAFLNHVKVGGKILNNPNHGGYLQWELGGDYPIFMDLELMLFTDEDFFLVGNAFLNSHVLAKVVESHRPSFIAPPISNRNFSEIIKEFPGYEPVFFDDVTVLFVDKTQHPEVAAKYKFKTLDPFRLKSLKIEALPKDTADLMLGEINKVAAIYPHGELVNQLQVQFARRNKDYDLALQYAKQLTENFPEKQTGFQLQGDILFERQLYGQALASYEKALRLSEGSNGQNIYKKIGVCFSKTGKPKEAYRAYKKAIRVFAIGTSAAEYYELGRFALEAGDIKAGIMYLRFAQQMISGEEKKMAASINALLLKAALQGQ